MSTGVSVFEDEVKQSVHYRGYIMLYEGNTRTKIHCKEVRVNKLKALEDSVKLSKKLKKKPS